MGGRSFALSKGESNIPDDDEVNTLVENYRKALIVHTYQQKLIEQRLSEEITEEEMKTYYENNKNLYVVDRSLVKGCSLKFR